MTHRINKVTKTWPDDRGSETVYRIFFHDEEIDVQFSASAPDGHGLITYRTPYRTLEIAKLAIQEHKRQILKPVVTVEGYDENGEPYNKGHDGIEVVTQPRKKKFGEELDWRMIGAGITVATTLFLIVFFLKSV